MSRAAFIRQFGAIYEHSPWIAEQAWDRGLSPAHNTVEGLHRLLAEILERSDHPTQLTLVNAHPDLAGSAALAGELSPASNAEQAGAGIQHCSAAEFARFRQLNQAYQAKFGFPFIKAVKGSHREQILAAFEARLQHSPAQEFQHALAEINKIALLRLQTL
ncbi:MAG: 2-oxo-4-hydroxy-4-carboxy-5-ureidoimidazoline decarboxylase [Motiliproteus sp.]